MFSCQFCSKSYTRKSDLKRHGDCRPKNLRCEFCIKPYNSEGSLKRHLNDYHGDKRKRVNDSESVPERDGLDLSANDRKRVCDGEPAPKRAKLDPPVKVSQHCRDCNVTIPQASYAAHLRTQQHKQNCLSEYLDGVMVIKTAFKSRIATFRITSQIYSVDVSQFLGILKEKVIHILKAQLAMHTALKVNMELFGTFILQTQGKEEVKSFNTKNEVVCRGTNLEDFYSDLTQVMAAKASEFQEKDSGWALRALQFLEVNINKFNPLRASSYLPLPEEIRKKLAVLNIKNTDQKCFLWSILAALHPVDWKNNANQVSHYRRFENDLKLDDIAFPVKLCDISKFENLNNISINVYGIENVFRNNKRAVDVVGPLYYKAGIKKLHVNLLLITDDYGESHYCLIKNLSRLISSQLNKTTYPKHLCDGCLVNFTSEDKLRMHRLNDCKYITVKLPGLNIRKDKYGQSVPENKLKFENFEKKLKIPFVVYADFETILVPLVLNDEKIDPEKSYTLNTHKLEPYSFAYYIKCSYDDSLSIFKTYRDDDVSKTFVEWLEQDCRNIYYNHIKPVIPMIPLTPQELREFKSKKNCHICEKQFKEDEPRVKDHDHLTGKFRGPAHSICNLNFKIPDFIPVFFHNLSFDSHLFICELAANHGKIDVIAQNKEKYISFSKQILIDTIENEHDGAHKIFFKLRFLDSFRFLSSSLSKLSENLSDFQCREVSKCFIDKRKFQLIRQKGVFPYDYVDSISKLDERQLPDRKLFYNSLKKENISEEDYLRALAVWTLFECKTLGDYSDIYLKSDVLLLADVFENFRDVCMETYGIDAAQVHTSPGLSWLAMQKICNIELDLLTDIDMVHFLRKGIRGGISQCTTRKSVANNQFLSDYNPSLETSFIMYLDATNLYGAAMSEYLPTGNFNWLSEENIKNFDYMGIPKNSNTGFVMEVDLEYPQHLHDKHTELPFCCESIVPPNSKGKVPKLIPNLSSKTRYVIHYRNLQQCVKHGLELTKIHRVLAFDQSPWLKKYIDLNTFMRNNAKSKFEKDFYKLMNNAVFGKTMENVEKRIDVKLVSHWENIGKRKGVEALIAQPNFKNVSIFREDLVAVQMEKLKINYNKPIYIGFCVLELSKSIMYSFYYDFIKEKYGDCARLLYMDTDSFILSVLTNNFYNDMKDHVDMYDTSNFALDNKYNIPVKQSVLGRMKDEFKGRAIKEFYGTGAKAYCINVDGCIEKRAKGVPKCVTEKDLSLDDYKTTAEIEGRAVYRQVPTIRSRLHEMYIELRNKVALSHSDNKRFLIPGSEKTLAWGHNQIKSTPL